MCSRQKDNVQGLLSKKKNQIIVIVSVHVDFCYLAIEHLHNLEDVGVPT